MNIKSQLYLLQLEDYDYGRFKKWIKDNPGKDVIEKKGKLKWTIKIRTLYFLAKFFGLDVAIKIYSPFDSLFKKSIILLASLKIKLIKNLTVVGITGSWGKTTAKEQIAQTLEQKYRVFKTIGNHNTILGVAIDILKMPLSTQIFVCEMGAYKRGEIREICNLVNPKVAVITTIGPMHLERFGSIEEIKKTKLEIFEKSDVKIGPDADWTKPICDFFQVAPLKEFKVPQHRQEIINANGLTIIDDSYNSNPVGFRLALKKMKGNPKILVTPGMIELGQLQFEENEKIAKEAVKICDYIIVVGETNKDAWKKGAPKAFFVKDIEEAKQKMSQLSKPGAVILLENDLPDQYE